VDETPVAGQQFDYTFDTIGNRTQIEAGGDQNAANLRVAGYTNNTLNQITSRGVPAAVDVMGDGLATNGVTVNGLTAYRKNEYFRQQLSVTNTSAAVWDSVTVVATGQTSVTGHAYVPKAPEDYTYDVDGNLLSDGRWNYTWDGENRLVSMTSLSTAPSGSQLQLLFTYDYMGRRIQKIVSTNNGSSYIGEYTNKYAYDGWNCVAILNPSLVLSNSFMWGSDLSGTIQGAGGVGGLVKVAYYGAATTNCFVAYDGNGNVSALINAADGTTSATYEYGPFGELLRATGPMAKLNPKRFQTATDDDETDLLYYGYRYYNPSTGRWLSRDPILEKGGLNLYVFNNNQPISKYDLLGLLTKTIRDGMWSQANVSSTPVWAPAGQTTYAGLIGTNFLRYAWIDADSQDTMQNYDPALYNWVTSHYSWNQGSLQEFNSAGYVGAGIAIEYVPSACGIKNGKASWNQVKIGRLWNSHDVSVSGNFFVDSPGGLISRMFKTRSQTFQLQMLFNGSVVATYTWSYSVNPTSSSPKPGDLAPQVTLTTPF
jgi:RHS repeat-associated protein